MNNNYLTVYGNALYRELIVPKQLLLAIAALVRNHKMYLNITQASITKALLQYLYDRLIQLTD